MGKKDKSRENSNLVEEASPCTTSSDQLYLPATVNNNVQGSIMGQWKIRRPASTESRIILDLYTHSVWGKVQGLSDRVIERPPSILIEKGISEHEWTQWMTRLKKEIQKSTLSVSAITMGCMSGIGLPWVFASFISRQLKMKRFNREMNEHLFEPLGLFWKTQTSSVQIYDYWEYTSWIAIALNPEEAEILKQEENVLYLSRTGSFHESRKYWTRFTEYLIYCGQRIQYF